MRLTAKIAYSRAPLTTSHPSPYTVIIPRGQWEEGVTKMIMRQMGVFSQMKSGEGGIMMLAEG